MERSGKLISASLNFNFSTDNKRSFFSYSYTWRSETSYLPPASCLCCPKRDLSKSVRNLRSKANFAPSSFKQQSEISKRACVVCIKAEKVSLFSTPVVDVSSSRQPVGEMIKKMSWFITT